MNSPIKSPIKTTNNSINLNNSLNIDNSININNSINIYNSINLDNSISLENDKGNKSYLRKKSYRSSLNLIKVPFLKENPSISNNKDFIIDIKEIDVIVDKKSKSRPKYFRTSKVLPQLPSINKEDKY